MACKSLEQQLRELLKDKVKMGGFVLGGGETAESYLARAAEALKGYISYEINTSVYGRTSKWYARSFDFSRALNDFIKVDPSSMTVTIGFDDDLAWHDSWFTKRRKDSGHEKQAYVPMAVVTGYRVFPRRGRRGDAPFVEGINYIQNAIDRFWGSGEWKGITISPDPLVPVKKWWK